MLTVAVWDLGVDVRPTSYLVPRVLRRVGADIAVLLRHDGSSPATVARQAGYRHRAQLTLAGETSVSILARMPLADTHVCASSDAIGHVTVHGSQGSFPLTATDLSDVDPMAAAHALSTCVSQCGPPWLAAGVMGHDLGNPFGPWLPLRRVVIDPGQVSGGVPSGPRVCGFLTQGLEPRGAGTLLAPGGGVNDLAWVRMSF